MQNTKEFKTYKQQIEILRARNLKFKNKRKAYEILEHYNYFDIINGFESILLKPNTKKKEYDNVYFEDFYDLFKFDLELKKHTLFTVFKIEAKLKTSIAYNFAKTHCNKKSTTMNYTNKNCYKKPNVSDSHLTNIFNKFIFFRKTTYKNDKVDKLSFINDLKKKKNYVKHYDHPPFWVIIKAIPLGTLYYTFLFLDQIVKPDVLKDFNFSLEEEKVFEQSIYLLKEIRNQCAHLELITRFKFKKPLKLNSFKDLSIYSDFSKGQFLNFMDVTKNFK